MKVHSKLGLLLKQEPDNVQKSYRHIAIKMRYKYKKILQIADFLFEMAQ